MTPQQTFLIDGMKDELRLPDQKPTIEERFVDWAHLNPHVPLEFNRRAVKQVVNGSTRLSAKWIVEGMRADPYLRTTGDDYKFDNSFTAHLARLCMEREPCTRGLFETR